MNASLTKLYGFLQEKVEFSNEIVKARNISAEEGFGKILETQLKIDSEELNYLLNEVVLEQVQEQHENDVPINFEKYIRYTSSHLGYKEVFVGNEWVTVHVDACVEFLENSDGGFSVSITHKENYATFSSSSNLTEYQVLENMVSENIQLNIELQNDYVSKEEHDWLYGLAIGTYETTKEGMKVLKNSTDLYKHNVSNSLRSKYAYKISKISKKVGKPIKAGRLNQATKKTMKKVIKKVDKLAKPLKVLSVGTIAYEVGTDTWDAHTIANGTTLAIGVAATFVGAPVVLTGIAIYGILDLVFDFGEILDENIGRNSGLWNDDESEELTRFPVKKTPLFNEAKIDNTYVAPVRMFNVKY